MAASNRGLKNIRTLSARVEPGALSCRGYQRIASLEMEKVRRGVERKSATHRIEQIDARLAEIEKEKSELLDAIQTGPKAGARLPGMEVKASPYRRAAGFRIRY